MSRAFLRVDLVVAATLVWMSSGQNLRGFTGQPFVVNLRKEHSKNVTEAERHQHHGGGYFVGTISLGKPEPQTLSVMFTTTTGLIVLPGSNCDSEGCKGHHRYYPAMSASSVDINKDGRPVDPAGGARALPGARRDTTSIGYKASHGVATNQEGNLVKDEVCTGNRLGNGNDVVVPLCIKAHIVVATKEDTEVFAERPEDGMIGLARKELSLTKDFNILERLTASGLQSQFGFFVNDDATHAQITFGGHDKSRVESSLKWAPVSVPEEGLWTIDIKGVRVGNKRLTICDSLSSPCRGLVSTGSPTIKPPVAESAEIMALIQGGRSTDTGCDLPDLALELENGVTLILSVEDYAGPRCEPEVSPHHLDYNIGGSNIWILGEPLFRRYYTVFDWKRNSIGFGRSTVERNCLRLAMAGFPTDQFKCKWPSDNNDEL